MPTHGLDLARCIVVILDTVVKVTRVHAIALCPRTVGHVLTLVKITMAPPASRFHADYTPPGRHG